MKDIKSVLLFTGSLLMMNTITSAQRLSITKGEMGTFTLVKGSNPLNYSTNGERIFITEKFESAVMNFVQNSYDAGGKRTFSGKLEVPGGTFNDAYGIREVVVFGNKEYAMVEHQVKETKKNSLLAREVSNGIVSKTETEVMSFTYEKLMNSGFHHVAVSPGNKKMAFLGELPYAKDMEASIKIAVYDGNMKREKEADLKIPGDDTKNKSIYLEVADDGTVYVIKRNTSKNGEKIITVYQWMEKDNKLSGYTITLNEPLYITSFAHAVNANNEIVVSGIYYKRATLTAGEQKMSGGFCYTNKGKSENVFKTFELDAPVENLVARKVLCNGTVNYLVAEQYKSVEDATPVGTSPMVYNYTYSHKSHFVIGLDESGTKKFQIELAKESSSRNFDQHDFGAFFICNNKLTAVYNDNANKYAMGSGLIPVLVQITNDGLMQSPVVFKDDLRLNYTLYPCYAVQDATNQLSFLMGNGSNMGLLTVKIED